MEGTDGRNTIILEQDEEKELSLLEPPVKGTQSMNISSAPVGDLENQAENDAKVIKCIDYVKEKLKVGGIF